MKKILITSAFVVLLFSLGKAQNVGISTNGATPNASALLDIDVSNLASNAKKGLLIPRMTAAEKNAMTLSTAAQGLLIYQTDGVQGFYYNTSTTTTPSWFYLVASANGMWELTGNAGTNSGSNFIGTIDATDLVFRTSATEVMRLYDLGKAVSIGSATPFPSRLYVETDIHGYAGYFKTAATGGSYTYGIFSENQAQNAGIATGIGTIVNADATGKTQGVEVMMNNSAPSKYGYVLSMSGTSNTLSRGIQLDDNTQTLDKIGIQANLNGNALSATGLEINENTNGNAITGIHTTSSGGNNGIATGILIDENTAMSVKYGIKANLTGTAGTDATGMEINNSATANNDKYGIKTTLSGQTNNNAYGLQVNENSAFSQYKYGIQANMSGGAYQNSTGVDVVQASDALGNKIGINVVTSSASLGMTNTTYGINISEENPSSTKYGVNINVSGNGNTTYGANITNNSSNTTLSYGLKVQNAATGGFGVNRYGIYSECWGGANDWAGYFNGRTYFSDKVGINTSNPGEALEVNGKIKIGNYTLPPSAGTTGQVMQMDFTGNASWATVNSGTVSSVDLFMPAAFTVNGGPVTNTGAFSVDFANQSANNVLAGPTSGAAATPSFRSLVSADIPDLSGTYVKNQSVNATFATGQTASFDITGNGEINGTLSVNGNVGVGTLSPSYKLDVTGTGRFTSALTVGAYTLPSTDGSNGQVLKTNGTGALTWSADNGGSGTVTSVGMSMPSIFSVSGSPVTTSGTLSASLANQSANTFFAGPSSGAASSPTFRTIVAADIPAGATGYIQNNAVGNNFTTGQAASFDVTGNGEVSGTFNINGNVGIGITTTDEKLDLNGNMIFEDNTFLKMRNSGTSSGKSDAMNFINGELHFGNTNLYDNLNKMVVYLPTKNSSNTSDGSMEFISPTLGSYMPLLHLNEEGKIGIATSTPDELVDINGNMIFENNALVKMRNSGTSSGKSDAMNFINGELHFGNTSLYDNLNKMVVYLPTKNSSNTSDGSMEFISPTLGSYMPLLHLNEEGKIGIATSTPDELVDINGNMIFENNALVKMRNSGTSSGKSDAMNFINGELHFGNTSLYDNLNKMVVYLPTKNSSNTSDGSMEFISPILGSYMPLLHLNEEGKIGIATSSPTELLDINGKTKTSQLQITTGATNGYVLKSDASGNATWQAGTAGTVTSVALTMPSIFSVSGSPITSSGTLSASLATQSANMVFAGPSSGAATTPTFRTLVAADIPTGATGYIQNNSVGSNFATGQAGSFDITGSGEINGTLNVNGNVGIGTTSASYKLDVTGTGRFTSAVTVGAYTLPSTDGTSGQVLKTNGSGALTWQTDNGGPFSGWGLTGNASTTAGTNFIGTTDAVDLVTKTNNTEWMRLTSGGNLGIGNASPQWQTDIVIPGSTSGTGLNIRTNVAGAATAYLRFTNTSNNDNSGNYSTYIGGERNGTGHALVFGTAATVGGAPAEKMRITEAGNVGIGCNSPQYKLHVIGDIASSGTVRTTNALVTGAITACSDVRFKKDFTLLENPLARVLKMEGYNYYWKTKDFPDRFFTDEKQIGFKAQDLQKILPEVVVTDTDGYLSVDYSRLTPILVEAIKEQNKEIEKDKNEIQDLKKRLERLEEVIMKGGAGNTAETVTAEKK